ncbi:hypothetical protein KIM372_03990 [Bombiscardovia nodaiensis]|uniref:Uncharacterized protein n=1 Tax=Bombiscardovia nodaiensis TaxID=2932181 RepID=A0ABN6SB54_9BIFI|nr:hypothetical protein KIM372_03990 [Bombiscardovia nodaiensis]
MPEKKPDIEQKNSQAAIIRRRRLALVIGVALVAIAVLFSAFVWPHWAPQGGNPVPSASSTTGSAKASQTPTKPAIQAQALPDNASDLLKATPDTLSSFARVKADKAQDWQASSPLEEYSLSYSSGDTSKDVTLHMAQWSKDDDANKQYQAVLSSLAGKEIASGKVKVSGKESGSYAEREDAADAKRVVLVWRNATVVFRAEGTKASVEAFFKDFPL